MTEVSSTEDIVVPEEVEGSADANEEAVSSTADVKDEETPESLLDAVKGAIDRKAGKEPSSGSEEAGKDDSSESSEVETTDVETPEQTEDEKDKKLPFHKHPRWQEMRSQRDNAVRERDNYRDAFEWKQKFDGYMTTASLTPSEFNTGLQIMAAMKKDPRSALQAIMPYVEQLQTATGEILPADLKQEVDEGYITAERAMELAQARTRVAMSDEASREARDKANQEIVTNLSNEASKWELQWQSSDPDYDRKKSRVHEKIEFALIKAQQTGKLPTTREAAVELCERARKEVENEISAWRPKPAPKPVEDIKNASSVRSSPQATSLIEAMTLALRK